MYILNLAILNLMYSLRAARTDRDRGEIALLKKKVLRISLATDHHDARGQCALSLQWETVWKLCGPVKAPPRAADVLCRRGVGQWVSGSVLPFGLQIEQVHCTCST